MIIKDHKQRPYNLLETFLLLQNYYLVTYKDMHQCICIFLDKYSTIEDG